MVAQQLGSADEARARLKDMQQRFDELVTQSPGPGSKTKEAATVGAA